MLIRADFDRLYDLTVGALRSGALSQAEDFIFQMEDIVDELPQGDDDEVEVATTAFYIVCILDSCLTEERHKLN